MQTYVPPDRLIPKTVSAVALFLLALGLAGVFLFTPSLENRPLHTDEAILADKLGTLMDEGIWIYDPSDYHGPTLPYSTLLTSLVSGKDSYSSLTKTSIRLVPAAYALLLLFLLPLVCDGLGRVSIGFAALFTAVSPMFLYYSRYYIMEVPFVVFTFAMIAFGWRYYMTRRVRWLLATGVAAGLVHATKETCIITFFALGVALFATGAIDYFVRGSGLGVINRKRKEPVRSRHIFWACILAAAVSVTLFSSFFTNLKGIAESFTTYASYLERGQGSGHEKPWHYYLQLLAWKPSGGLVWSSAAILAFALVGSGYAFLAAPDRNKNLHLPRFLTIYAIVTLGVYSFISYKTPWSILSFHQATLILAGYGAWNIVQACRSKLPRFVALAVIAAACYNLTQQSLRANGRYAADSRNPYVYTHTSTNFEKLVTRITELETLNGSPLHIEVAHPESAWPLKWYFRDHKKIAYRQGVEPGTTSGDLIIAADSFAADLSPRLESTHTPDGPYGLRPDSRLAFYVRKDLWEKFMASRR